MAASSIDSSFLRGDLDVRIKKMHAIKIVSWADSHWFRKTDSIGFFANFFPIPFFEVSERTLLASGRRPPPPPLPNFEDILTDTLEVSKKLLII